MILLYRKQEKYMQEISQDEMVSFVEREVKKMYGIVDGNKAAIKYLGDLLQHFEDDMFLYIAHL